MKYWTGYITAGVIGAITWALMQLAERFTSLVDMVYPYISRTVMTFLADWSSGVDFCLWQVVVIAFIVVLIASIVLMIMMKWNPVRWLGWVLAVCSVVYFLNTLVFGLNYYAGSIADDIRMEMEDFNAIQLAKAAEYYREEANRLAVLVERDENGEVVFDEFEILAEKAADGFDALVNEHHFSIFAGSTVPVKELGWSDMYTSMGITGFTLGLTGEAAVNPNIPALCLPFTMCHEMAHRMSIATESDANFAAFLACAANEDLQYQYSAYFMAYRYCYNALVSSGSQLSTDVAAGACAQLKNDMSSYSEYFSSRRDEKATKVADTVNDTYLKTSGDSAGIASYGNVCDLLYSWYYQEEIRANHIVEENPFNPFDETQVDLTGNANAKEVEE